MVNKADQADLAVKQQPKKLTKTKKEAPSPLPSNLPQKPQKEAKEDKKPNVSKEEPKQPETITPPTTLESLGRIMYQYSPKIPEVSEIDPKETALNLARVVGNELFSKKVAPTICNSITGGAPILNLPCNAAVRGLLNGLIYYGTKGELPNNTEILNLTIGGIPGGRDPTRRFAKAAVQAYANGSYPGNVPTNALKGYTPMFKLINAIKTNDPT